MEQININAKQVAYGTYESGKTSNNSTEVENDASIFNTENKNDCRADGSEAEDYCTHELCELDDDVLEAPDHPVIDDYGDTGTHRSARDDSDEDIESPDFSDDYGDTGTHRTRDDNGGGGSTGSDSGAHFLV